MSTDVTQVRVAAGSKVVLQPIGATPPVWPADTTTAWDAGFVDVGLTSDNGVIVTPTVQTKDVYAAQTLDPIRVIPTSRTLNLAIVLEQWNTANLRAAFGGGTVTVTGTGATRMAKFTPPAPGSMSQFAVGIEITDGLVVHRWLWYNCQPILSGSPITLSRTDAIMLPLTFRALASSSGQPFDLIGFDSNLVATS